ncbi:ADP-glyceromanno-heptose 6-epimerase [Bacteriovorax sp. BSW11_IV]|uniref:ADP-glyceromanno-heptose 6-epimerase n=1 Tax=Bacteriovorax sp. BSW11_IV TaxID=1353529 RepID=UPI00038A3D41|nr:ADP-glyceromanno-heptose 6-epimerase [Bacteriovorax sp. BSW11_IV]EQC44586.1 ADP-glyceromanno-heptose 6-epimerase [Bacteriovorax sp. BSW11_IV]
MILLTGGAGFIGSVLLKELNNIGREDIVVVDRLRDGVKWLNLRGLKFQEYILADELFDGDHDDVLSEITCIFHMGACSATTERDVDYLMKNNVVYSQNLFHIALNRDIPFIYASSAATYGAGEHGYCDNEKEISKLRPLNPYGWSKQLFDEWVLRQKEKPTKWFGVKFFNVYGPNEYHKADMRSLVHKAFGQINEIGMVKLFKSHKEGYEDGKQLRDFVYGPDVALAMIEMMKTSNVQASGIYNLGTGKARSFYDLMMATFDAMNVPAKVEFIDMPMSIRNQYQYFTEADMTKFFKLFPKFKFRSVEEGVGDYVKNYLLKEDPHY